MELDELGVDRSAVTSGNAIRALSTFSRVVRKIRIAPGPAGA
jgi:hypothetical protein